MVNKIVDMAELNDEESYTLNSCVRGHHVYREIWNPFVGQELDVKTEPTNPRDMYAVAIILNAHTVVGHVPIEFGKVAWYFLQHGGRIKCTITGHRQLSDEHGKGLEVPCSYRFSGMPKLIKKLVKLMNKQ